MVKPLLHVADLCVRVDGKTIVQDVGLNIKGGEIHAIMGPHGTGKSTLARALMGHPRYDVTAGEVLIDGRDLLKKKVDERARAGLFLAMEEVCDLQGVTNAGLIRTALQARRGASRETSLLKFGQNLQAAMSELHLDLLAAERPLHEGSSVSENIWNELLQMVMLKPKVAMWDDIDSILEPAMLQELASALEGLCGPDSGLLIFTRTGRLLEDLEPDVVHVMIEGRIVCSGGKELAIQVAEQGYAGLGTAPEGGGER